VTTDTTSAPRLDLPGNRRCNLSSAEVHFAHGKNFRAENKIEAACVEFDAALRISPSDMEIKIAAAEAFSLNNDADLACRYVKQVIEGTSGIKSGWLRYLLARTYIRASRMAEAMMVVVEAFREGICFAELHEILADCYMANGEAELYLREMDNAANLKDEHGKCWVYYEIAKTLLFMGRYSDALSTVDCAISIEPDPFFTRLRSAIGAVMPDEELAKNWHALGVKPQSRAFVTVAFKGEIGLLRMQARSMGRFLKDLGDVSIYVVVNDPDYVGFMEEFERSVRPEYGPLRDRLTVFDRNKVYEDKYDVRGWRSQQFLKLLVANIIDSDQMIIMDAKNHFIRDVDRNSTLAEDGASITWLADRRKDFTDEFRKTYSYFGVNPDLYIDHNLPTITPFVVPRLLVKEAVSYVENREKLGFVDFFLGAGSFLTEFLLISGYCQMRYGSLAPVFRFGPKRVVGIWSATLKFPTGVESNILELNRDEAVYSFAVHRKAAASLAQSHIDAIASLWRSKGLLRDGEDARHFL
jgi:tetratricopeptide (TPR) repeat protein